jgi:putative ABC transport system permease protein
MSATNPVFAVMRNLIPSSGGRYVNDIDVDRRRRVVFLGDKLKQDLFGEADAVGRTVMVDNVPFLVVGVMQEKAQDSSYSGRDRDKAFIPDTTFKGLFSERYVSNFIFQARHPSLVAAVTKKVYEVLGRRLKFDPADKEAVGMWDTSEGEKFFDAFFLTFRAFLGVIGSFTLMVGGLGVSNIMYVVVEERTREIGVKLAVGAKPRFIQMQFLLETLTLTAIGGLLGFAVTLAILFVFPFLGLDEYVGTPVASPLVIAVTASLLGTIGFVAGYFPARRASLLDPVVALKLS